jgi:hypothetical protein
MSNQLSNVYIAAFDRDVKREYVQRAQLRKTVKLRTGVVGESYRFQKSFQGLATRAIPQAEVVPMNIDYDKVTTLLQDWNAPEYTSIFDQQKINFEERQDLVMSCAQAITRREDQLVIDAAQASHFVDEAGNFATAMSTETFRAADFILTNNNVPQDQNRTMIMNARAKDQLLGDDSADTVDKNTVKILYKGEIMHWLGFNIYIFGKMQEGGLPNTGNPAEQYAFAYHKPSIGLAVGINMRTEINYIPDRVSWLVNSVYSANSVTIDTDGVVRVRHLGT